MKLSKDDLELTLKELKGQRTQATIQLAVIEAGIVGFENRLKNFGK